MWLSVSIGGILRHGDSAREQRVSTAEASGTEQRQGGSRRFQDWAGGERLWRL